VELDRATAIGGGPAPGPQPRLDVRIQAPGSERAAELRRRIPWAAPAADGVPEWGRAPLLEGLEPPAAVGHLSYSALAAYAGCHYRFYVERVIGLEAPAVGEDPGDGQADGERPQPDELRDPAAGPRERALAIGNAVPAALQASAPPPWIPPAPPQPEPI